MIVLEELEYSFPSGKSLALVRDRQEFIPGDIVAVTGGNGTGKTTLLRLLAGALTGYRGTLVVPADTAKAFVPATLQHFLLPWYTVAENIRFFETRGADIRSGNLESYALDIGALLGRAATPELLNRPTYTLSAGESAATALVCALRTKPMLLLLDEIFANGSRKTVDCFIKRLDQFSRCGGVLVFTNHRTDTHGIRVTKRVQLGDTEES